MASKATTSGIGTAVGAGLGAATGTGPVGMAIGSSLGGLVGGLFGDSGSQGVDDALAQYNGLVPPDIAKALVLKTYQAGGTLTPQMLQKLNLNSDQAQNIIENPDNRDQQEGAVNALKQLSQTGMSAQDLAQMQAMRSQVGQDTQAKVQSLLQQQQERGQSDSGSTLASQLSAVQNGSQQASHDALQQGAAAASARQQALAQYANLSSQIRGQDYATQKANTDNEIARQRFLDQNSLSRQSTNASATNNANLYNLQRAQSTSDTNVATSNNEQARQAQAAQQQFQDAMSLAQSKANANLAQASAATANNAASAQGLSNITGGLATIAGGAKNNDWSSIFGSKKDTVPGGNPDTQDAVNLSTSLSPDAKTLSAKNFQTLS